MKIPRLRQDAHVARVAGADFAGTAGPSMD